MRRDYRDDTHLLSLFAYGRGNYSYITREREWQQTTGFFGKLANSHTALIDALDREGINTFPTVPRLPRVARFEFFRQGERAAGVWVVRQGIFHFALPITTGPKPGIADYLPSPHGLPGFAAPVEQITPALTPYVELADGRTIVATDGADEITPSPDGQSLRVRWRRWAVIGTKSGELTDPGLTTEVVWRLQKNKLIRQETLTATKPITIRHWELSVPISYPVVATKAGPKGRKDRFMSDKGTLEVQMHDASFAVSASVTATGDTPLGRGVHGAIPLHLVFESDNLNLIPNRPQTYSVVLSESSK